MAAKTNGRSVCEGDTFVVPESSSVGQSSVSVGQSSVSVGQSSVSVGQSSVSVAEEDGDAPAVFLCGQCRRPVGDSLAWAGSDEELNQIMLKRVNDNIAIGKEPYVSCTRNELGCLVVNLTCRGCGSTLGLMYTSTPKQFDFKRSLFCFGVENIESYVLGSADQQMAAVDREERPVTLEFQDIVQQEMTKIKSLAVTIGQRLLEVEVDLQSRSGPDMSCS